MPASDELRDEMKLSTVQRYLTGSETLRLTVYNSAAGVTVTFSGRRYDPDVGISEFAHRLVPTTARVATVLDVPAGAGWLLGCAVRVTAGTPQDGQTYAVVEVGNGAGGAFNALDVLCGDTISAAKRLAWPGSALRGPLDGAGAIRTIAGTSPAAGAEISETVPAGARWQLLAFRVLITTSAVVGNRAPYLTIDDGTMEYFSAGQNVVTAASSNKINRWTAGVSLNTGGIAGQAVQALGTMQMLTAGHRIRTSTTAIDVGDQYSAVLYQVREWIEGA